MPVERPQITSPIDLIRLARPLFFLERQINGEGEVRIVAIGSSSTAGEGDIPPYPGRLERALGAQYPGRVTVINRGGGGQEASLELARFDRDVIAEAPALAIWQLGTNAAYKHYDLADISAAIDRGLARLAAQPMDVVLMDPQYVPALLDSHAVFQATERMVQLIAEAADRASVGVFRRFALMRHWHVADHVPVADMANDADTMHLHMNEWSTAAVSEALKAAIDQALFRASAAVALEPGPRV